MRDGTSSLQVRPYSYFCERRLALGDAIGRATNANNAGAAAADGAAAAGTDEGAADAAPLAAHHALCAQLEADAATDAAGDDAQLERTLDVLPAVHAPHERRKLLVVVKRRSSYH